MAKIKNALFAEERQSQLLQYLEQNQKAAVPQLSKIFKVSGATIRNDLRELETRGMLRRTHGGALPKSKTGIETEIDARAVLNSKEKKMIAQKALDLIEDGDTVILDAGTTILELAKLIHKKKNITVVTNDLKIALALEADKSIHTIVMGGLVRNGFHCTIGSVGDTALKSLSVDKAFMACNAISPEKGAGTPDLIHADTKKSMVSVANSVIILADHTKFGITSFVQFAPAKEIDFIVTDEIAAGEKRKFESKGIKILS
jgi:DeoR family fructose operon transcriptional repressor